MNILIKWLGERRGKRLCRYCKNTWLNNFVPGDNCVTCPKCRALYSFDWKHTPWPTSFKNMLADPDRLKRIHINFYRNYRGESKDYQVLHNFVSKETEIITDFGSWCTPHTSLKFPLMADKITPYNVQEKVKTFLMLS
jgi:hypothetical protein